MDVNREFFELSVLAGLLFSSLLAAFYLRRWFGLTPLLMTFGVIEAIKHFIAMPMRADFFGLGDIGIGSAVFFTASLAIALVLYIKEGIKAVMPVAWGLFTVALTCTLITACIEPLSGGANVGVIRLEVAPIWNLLVGSSLLFLDIAALAIVHGWVMRFGTRPLLSLSVAILAVVCVDSLLYSGLTQPGSVDPGQLGLDIAAKSLFGLFYALIAWCYFRWIDHQNQDSQTNPYTRLTDFFSVFDLQHRVSQLEKLANEDALTGTFNRRYLESTIAQQIVLDQQRGFHTGILVLDIDYFKDINDRFGHTVGDVVLRHIVMRIRGLARSNDCLCRIGGEEFVYVMTNCTWPQLIAKAQSICHDIASASIDMSDKTPAESELRVTLTAGAALSGDDGKTMIELLAVADARMYQGKRAGRNRAIGKAIRLLATKN